MQHKLPGAAAAALWGENTITVLPIVVVKSKNPYTVCVIKFPLLTVDDGICSDTAGLTNTGPTEQRHC